MAMKDLPSTEALVVGFNIYDRLQPVVEDFRISDDEQIVVLQQWPEFMRVLVYLLEVNTSEQQAIQSLRLSFRDTPNRPLSERIQEVLAKVDALEGEITAFKEGLKLRLCDARENEKAASRSERQTASAVSTAPRLVSIGS